MADPAPVKAPPPAQPLEPDTVFVRNPGGAIHDIHASHPGAVLAASGNAGWRFATDQEIKAYAAVHTLEVDSKAVAASVKALRAAEQPPELPPAPSAEEAGLEPVDSKAAKAEPEAEAKGKKA